MVKIKPTIILNRARIKYKPIIPSGLVLVIDTREQAPYKPDGALHISKKLEYGDYSIKGFENQVSIERKNLEDFYRSIGKDRERFKHMLERMQEAEFKGLLIEAYEDEVLEPELSYSSIHSNSVYSTIIALEVKYNLHVYYGNRKDCENKLINWLVYFYRMKRRV